MHMTLGLLHLLQFYYSEMAQAQLPYQQQQVFRDRETNNVQVPSHELPDWSSVQCQKSLKVVLKWEILNLVGFCLQIRGSVYTEDPRYNDTVCFQWFSC